MSKTVSERSSYQLFLWGLLLLPLAHVADSVLDAVLFGQGNLKEQLMAPSYHEVSERILFSIFILAGIYLGMHFLGKSARKERTLQQRNRDLALAKQEIEVLDENASKHLRNTAAELSTALNLLSTLNGDLDEEKQKFLLEGVSKACDRLDTQVEIFTMLAASPAAELHRERVKLDHLANEVITALRHQCTDQRVEFKVQPWMHAWCDPKLLYQVIEDLFSNALDSLPGDREGRIEFGMHGRNGQKVFFVSDNGNGFSETQAKRLFDPFRDVSQDSSLPRNALRLVNAGRLIRLHGGKIWAEGIPGASGTIFFTHSSR